jgi:hypothetical protein
MSFSGSFSGFGLLFAWMTLVILPDSSRSTRAVPGAMVLGALAVMERAFWLGVGLASEPPVAALRREARPRRR